jgi:Rieske Fe-S protein
MTSPNDKSQWPADSSPTGEDLRPPSRDEAQAANALDERIERMRAERRAKSARLSSDEARMQVMAAGLRAQRLDADEPDPDFIARLRQRLLDSEEALEPVSLEERRRSAPSRPKGVSRRVILTGGLGVAAAAAAGIAVGVGVERAATAPQSWPALVPEGRGVWLPVAEVDELAVGQTLRFTANSVVGFLRRTADGYAALSGACTHMGCFLDWNASARTYDCPCHGGRFTEDGASAPSSPVAYRPLPTLQTRVEDGKVWVYVPASSVAPNGGSPTITPYASHGNESRKA